jgi:hypothetical protein
MHLPHLKFTESKMFSGMEGLHAKAGHQQRMCRQMKRSQKIGKELFMIFNERCQEIPISSAIDPQGVTGYCKRAMEVKGRSILEGMGKGNFGLYPGQAVSMELAQTKERRRNGKGKNGSANIMNEMGEGKLGRTDSSAYRFSGFHQQDRFEFTAQLNGSSKTIRSCPHNNGIAGFSVPHQRLKSCHLIFYKANTFFQQINEHVKR